MYGHVTMLKLKRDPLAELVLAEFWRDDANG
jgi:hypothetical protein